MAMIAKNRFVMTKRIFVEGVQRASGARLKRPSTWIEWGLLVAAIACCLFLLVRSYMSEGITSLFFWLLLLIPPAVLGVLKLLSYLGAEKLYRAMEKRDGKDRVRITSFYADHLTVETREKKETVFYRDIGQVLHTRRLLVLIEKRKPGVPVPQSILLPRDSYQFGSEKNVLDQIRKAKKGDRT